MLPKNCQDKIDNLFLEFNQHHRPGCAMGITWKGEQIYSKGFGMSNLEIGTPITPKTVFHGGSVSKQFTALCTALLADEEWFSRKDDIRIYFPEMGPFTELINIDHLLHMTCGLQDIYFIWQFLKGYHEDDLFTEEEALDLLTRLKTLMFSPGERFSYSNTAYFILGQLVKRVTGKSLTELSRERIFKPLGMSNTFFREDRTRLIPGRAAGYCPYEYMHSRVEENKTELDNEHCNVGENCELPGAGQLWTTVEDLHLWALNFLADCPIGDKKFIKKITSPGTLNSGLECNYSHGYFLGRRKGRKYLFHEGGSTGYNAFMYILPAEELAIYGLANSNYFLSYLYQKLGMEPCELISDFILEEEITPSDTSQLLQKNTKAGINDPGSSEFNLYAGSYQYPVTSTIWKIRAGTDGLLVDENGIKEIELWPAEENTFCSADNYFTCTFKLQEDRTVEKLKVDLAGTKESQDFLPFVLGDREYLQEFVGEYYCEDLETAYVITVEEGRLQLKNKDRHRSAQDFFYKPGCPDHFYTFNPPLICCYYSISFLRDTKKAVNSMIFRDYDGDKREVFQFKKQKRG